MHSSNGHADSSSDNVNRARAVLQEHLDNYGLTLDSNISDLGMKTKSISFNHHGGRLLKALLIPDYRADALHFTKLFQSGCAKRSVSSPIDENTSVDVYDIRCKIFCHNSEACIVPYMEYANSEADFQKFLSILALLAKDCDLLMFCSNNTPRNVSAIIDCVKDGMALPPSKKIRDVILHAKFSSPMTDQTAASIVTDVVFCGLSSTHNDDFRFDWRVVCWDFLGKRVVNLLGVAEKPSMSESLALLLQCKKPFPEKFYFDSGKYHVEIYNLVSYAFPPDAYVTVMSTQILQRTPNPRGIMTDHNHLSSLIPAAGKDYDFVIVLDIFHRKKSGGGLFCDSDDEEEETVNRFNCFTNTEFSDTVKEFINVPEGKEFKDYAFRKTFSLWRDFEHVEIRKLGKIIPHVLLDAKEKPMILIIVKTREDAKSLATTIFRHTMVHPCLYPNKDEFRFFCKMFDRMTFVTAISTCGHLFTSTFESNVPRNATKDLFAAKIVNKITDGHAEIIERISELARFCDFVNMLLDDDYEGEFIISEVGTCVKDVLKWLTDNNLKDFVFRAKFSSATESLKAMNNLVKPNVMHSLAMKFKHDFDLCTGWAFTRFITYILRKIFPDLDIKSVPFGTCRSLCLKIVVDRYNLRQHYLKNSQFALEVTVFIGDEQIKVISQPFDTKEEAENLCEKLKNKQYCEVLHETAIEKIVKEPPAGLNSPAYLKFMSKYYHQSSADTAQGGQTSYTRGEVTYPRTESTKYPEDLEIKSLFRRLFGTEMNLTAEELQNVLDRGISKGDHPPLMPTEMFNQSNATTGDLLILNWFKASFMPANTYFKESTTFGIDDFRFTFECFKPDQNGFTDALRQLKVQMSDKDFSNEFSVGTKFLFDAKVIELPAPSLLAEWELIESMEEYKIGTDGTIPSHITKLEENEFVIIGRNRQIAPTKLGIEMTKAFEACIPEMIDPSSRAKFADAIDEIANGNFEDFVRIYSHYLRASEEHFKIFEERFEEYVYQHKSEFEACFKPHQR